MVIVLQSTLNIMQFKALWLPKCKIIFKNRITADTQKMQRDCWKLAAYDNKNAIMSAKLHMLHTTECYTTLLKICYIDS